MRIAVDARELAARPTGVGRYLSELIASWSRDPTARDCELTLYAPGAFDLPAELVGTSGARVITSHLPGGHGTVWEQWTLRRGIRGRADVLFSPGYSAPILSSLPIVVAIHDLSFWAHPEWFASREGTRRRLITRWSARRAARILTISEFSKREIQRHLQVPESRVVVTPLAPARRFGRAVRVDDTGAASGKRDPLVLYVGSLLNRRHVPALVRGFASLARSNAAARLVIVGDNRTFPPEDPAAIARLLGVENQVDVRSYVPDTELDALYRRASAFAFLSEYEGFGLTPLEAMSAGVPVVAYDTEVAREVYGDAALLVNPGDLDGITAALRAAIDDSVVRTRLLSAATARLGGWSWDATARATLDVLKQASGSARRP